MIALNRRRYMGGGGGLPYDAEVEYVVGTSEGFWTSINNADIGFIRIVKQFASKPSGTTGDGLYSYPSFYGCIGYISNNWLGIQWGAGGSEKKILGYDADVHTYELDVVNSTGTVDNTSVSLTISNTKGVFGINTFFTNRCPDTRYISTEVYNMDMVKVLDLIPIRVGQQGGFYDKISETVMGVGSFTAGPDKTT